MAQFEKKREEAQKLHLNNLLDKAEKIYRYLISRDPKDCDVANLGAMLRKQGRHKESIDLYQEWLAHEERAVGVYINAINCAIECDRLDLAERWIKRGVNIHGREVN